MSHRWILVLVAVSLVCKAQSSCPRLPQFPRGEITFRQDSTGAPVARYACRTAGYRLQGERLRRCQGNNRWSGFAPICRAMAICPEIEEGDHLIRHRLNGRRREGVWTYGSRHTFSCEEGYVLDSTSTSQGIYPAIKCARNGWNASIPTCIDVPRCPTLLEEIANGRSTAENRTYASQESIEFICNDGYRTTSQSWRTCSMSKTINGYISEWLGVTPRCEETTCPPLRGKLENGDALVTSLRVGANVTFWCSSGYELIGESRLTCTRLGQWNGSVPVCETGENDCPVLAIPLNGDKNGNRYNVHDNVRFSCDSGYALAGSENRRCRREGLWDGEPVRCIGSKDFDDINELSVKFRGNLDNLQVNALYEAEVNNDSANVVPDNRARFIPLTHTIGLDLYFMFDGSSSVGITNFEKSKTFAKALVREIGVTNQPNSLKVGALVFNSNADVIFHTVEFTTTEDVVAAINGITYEGGGTNIALAFDRLLTVLIPQRDINLNRHGSFKTVFLITDGAATEGGDAREIAKLVKEKGVTIHTIGISEDASRRTLTNLASDPQNEHLFFLKDYSELEKLIKLVTNQTIDYSVCGKNSGGTLPSNADAKTDTPANIGAWPWQILFNIQKDSENSVCGGTLIKPNWILTAAHCFDDFDSFEAYAGILDRLDKRKELKLETYDEAIIHPNYESATKRNDIALIQLTTAAKLSTNVRPACLPDPEKEERLLTRGSAVMTGWGYNSKVERGSEVQLHPETFLQQLTLPLYDEDNCRASLVGDTEEDWFDDGMTCAGYRNTEVGACRGDSGGPLIKNARVGKERRWVVIGVNSWGIGCALENELDFFTNVAHFMDWINGHINPAVEPGN